jgi:3D (Asp-Asp-Asp) domain-containing protein
MIRRFLITMIMASMVPVHVTPGIEYFDLLTKEYEEEAQVMRCTCYLPTGYSCYDGHPTVKGVISSNTDHVGQTAILYTLEDELIGVFECHDIGGNVMLRNGTAIDVYRDTMSEALEWVGTYGDYVKVRWIYE